MKTCEAKVTKPVNHSVEEGENDSETQLTSVCYLAGYSVVTGLAVGFPGRLTERPVSSSNTDSCKPKLERTTDAYKDSIKTAYIAQKPMTERHTRKAQQHEVEASKTTSFLLELAELHIQ